VFPGLPGLPVRDSYEEVRARRTGHVLYQDLAGILAEEEGHRGLGPDDELRALACRLTRQLAIDGQCLILPGWVPLHPLIDVPLHEGDPHGGVLCVRRRPQPAVSHHSRHEQPRGGERGQEPRPTFPGQERPRQGGIHRQHHERHAVHPGQRCHLNQRDGPVLGIAQQVPGEAREEGGAQELQGDPKAGGPHHVGDTGAERGLGENGAEGRPVEGEVADEPEEDQARQGPGQPPVADHCLCNP
jgi:hypothetical protein